MKGILFKPWKIVYIAEHPDIEIQTRRVVKFKKRLNPKSSLSVQGGVGSIADIGAELRLLEKGIIKPDISLSRYQQGETVYIKEVWQGDKTKGLLYKADCSKPRYHLHHHEGKWQSPLFMPERFARYFITITDVRAERLQEITYEDCYAEGIDESYPNIRRLSRIVIEQVTPKTHFKELWNSINKDYQWESNPWVWVYTLRQKLPG